MSACFDTSGRLIIAGYAQIGSMSSAQPVIAVIGQSGAIAASAGMGSVFSSITGIAPAPDSGFFAAGFIAGGVTYTVVARLKPDLDTVWTKKDSYFFPSCISAAGDGGCVVIGSRYYSYSEPARTVVQRYDNTGAIGWQREYMAYVDGETRGNVSDNYFYGKAIVQTRDSGFICTGTAMVKGGWRGFVNKLDSSGISQWSAGKIAGGTTTGAAVLQTKDGGYCAAGSIVDSVIIAGGNGIFVSRLLLVKYAAGANRTVVPAAGRPRRASFRRYCITGKSSVTVALDPPAAVGSTALLYSNDGRVVRSYAVSGKKIPIALYGANQGIYCLRYTGNDRKTHTLFISIFK